MYIEQDVFVKGYCAGELLFLLLVPTTNSDRSARVRCSYQLLLAFGADKSLFLTAAFHAWISSRSSGDVCPGGRSVAFSLLPVLGFSGSREGRAPLS